MRNTFSAVVTGTLFLLLNIFFVLYMHIRYAEGAYVKHFLHEPGALFLLTTLS